MQQGQQGLLVPPRSVILHVLLHVARDLFAPFWLPSTPVHVRVGFANGPQLFSLVQQERPNEARIVGTQPRDGAVDALGPVFFTRDRQGLECLPCPTVEELFIERSEEIVSVLLGVNPIHLGNMRLRPGGEELNESTIVRSDQLSLSMFIEIFSIRFRLLQVYFRGLVPLGVQKTNQNPLEMTGGVVGDIFHDALAVDRLIGAMGSLDNIVGLVDEAVNDGSLVGSSTFDSFVDSTCNVRRFRLAQPN